jgi:hypothetical protein
LPIFDQIPQQVKVNHNDVLCESLENEIVLFQLSSQQYYSLGAVGAHVWKLLGESGDVATVAKQLCDAYTGEPAAIIGDFHELVSEMLSAGLLQPV